MGNTRHSRLRERDVRVTVMDITSLISDLLTRADWLAYSNWDLVHGVLDAVIPDAWSNYQP